VTARGYCHDLDRFRRWIEEHRAAIPLGRITAVDLINYRQHLVRDERLQATTINRATLRGAEGWLRRGSTLRSIC